MWSTIVFPIILATVKVIVYMYFVAVVSSIENVFLADVEASFSLHSADKTNKTTLAPSSPPIPLNYMHIYNIIAFLWTQLFISDVIQMVIAGTFTTWYWTFKKTEVPPFPLAASLKTTLKYHLGTAALGSLTINICLIPRIFLSLCLIKESCFRYTVSYMEKFLRQFNRNAYIVCAMHGKSLRSSGSSAYEIILPNLWHYFGLNAMAGIFFGVSKILIVIGSAIIAIACFDVTCLSSVDFLFVILITWLPRAFLVASSFFSVYSMAVDTLTLCCCEYDSAIFI